MEKKSLKIFVNILAIITIGLAYIAGYQDGKIKGEKEGKDSMMAYKDHFDSIARSKKVSRNDVSV